MTFRDSFVVYLKAKPDGSILNARYEVHDEDSYCIIDAMQMSEAWCQFERSAYEAIQRLVTLAITAALNAPSERALQLSWDDDRPKLSLLVAGQEPEQLPLERF